MVQAIAFLCTSTIRIYARLHAVAAVFLLLRLYRDLRPCPPPLPSRRSASV